MKQILIIDGQGGGLGRQLVEALSARCSQAQLTAVGTNSLAASAMRKAVEARQGTAFSAKQYHDKVLSYGAPPVRFVRQLMLDEPIK